MSVRSGALARLHVVTDDAVVGRPGFADLAGRLLAAAGPAMALHLRHRGSGERLFALAADLVDRARQHGAALIVNRRVDVALATGAHGVHLGRRAIPARDARSLLGEGAWVGRSAHAVAELDRLDEAVDYALLGAIFPTASHPGRPALGLGALALASARAPLPVMAIGGVDASRARDCLRAGAYGLAVLRAVWSARRPEREVRRLVEILEAEA